MIFSNKLSQYNNIISLSYEANDKVIITNFPNSQSPKYNPKGKEESFKITSAGLIPHNPTKNKLPTFFFFKSLDNNKEMAKVEFDKDNKKLIVTSTGVIYNGSAGVNAFSFQLKNGSSIRTSEIIKGDGNADKFKSTLDNTNFEYGDEIILGFINKDKVDLKNYPDIGNNYDISALNTQKFTITPSGVIPILTPNKITVKSQNNEEILYITFIKDTHQIIVSSSGKIPNLYSSDDYFTLIIKDEDGTTILNSILKSNENANKFKTNVTGKIIEFGKHLLTFIYKDKSKIEISNHPRAGLLYIPKFNITTFKVFSDHLEEISLDSQEINFSNIAKINFDITNNQLTAISTGNILFPNIKNTSYFLFKLRNSSNNIKIYSYIKADEPANKFAKDLNGINFQFGDVIELECLASNIVSITNFPSVGKTKFIDKTLFNMESYKEFFTLMPQGLQYYNPTVSPPIPIIPNTIKINKLDDSNLVFINFNTLDKVFQTFSFGQAADTSSKYDYVLFKLYNSNNILIFSNILPSNNIPFYVITKLNLKNFDFGYTLDLTYDYRSKSHIVITNLNGQNHVPSHTKERYKITSTGLNFIPIFLKNIITINSINNVPCVSIEFNTLEKKFLATNLNTIADLSSKYDYVTLNLYNENDVDFNSTTITLISNNNRLSFINKLNSTSFDYGYILEINCSTNALNKITISDFSTQGQSHIVSNSIEYYEITVNGLAPYSPILSNNSIKTRAKFNASDAVTLNFDTNLKKLKVTSNGKKVSDTNPLYPTAFQFTIKNNNGIIKKSNFISSNTNGDNFASDLNDLDFKYGDTIELYSYNKNRTLISNFPISLNTYFLSENTQTFTITTKGLKLPSTSQLGSAKILNNIISILGNLDYLVSQIYFDTKTKTFIVTSSSDSANENFFYEDYFKITIKNSIGALKDISRIIGLDSADAFANSLNRYSFEYGDTITLEFKENNRVLISNFPIYGKIYKPNDLSPKTFSITKSGLILQ